MPGSTSDFCVANPATSTDAFAFGLIIIELLSSLNPAEARRAIVDDGVYEEIPALIRKHHDSAAGPFTLPV